jgi:hypothetical protein
LKGMAHMVINREGLLKVIALAKVMFPEFAGELDRAAEDHDTDLVRRCIAAGIANRSGDVLAPEEQP